MVDNAKSDRVYSLHNYNLEPGGLKHATMLAIKSDGSSTFLDANIGEVEIASGRLEHFFHDHLQTYHDHGSPFHVIFSYEVTDLSKDLPFH